MPINSRNKDKFYNYDAFVDKFKPKKTTDECYTPPEIYECIKEWVIKEYGIDEEKIVRPFYPGGDFENFDYTGGKVVVDNPPFSILKKIKDFYSKNNIKFFLFAPHLTLFSVNDDKSICYIVTAVHITYLNNAYINTSFVTNIDKYKIRLVPSLRQKIKNKQKNNKKSLTMHIYPSNVISSSNLDKIINKNISLNFKNNEVYYIKTLDKQKAYKKTIYGGGYLISDRKAKMLEKIKKDIKDNDNIFIWSLSDRENEIIKRLD